MTDIGPKEDSWTEGIAALPETITTITEEEAKEDHLTTIIGMIDTAAEIEDMEAMIEEVIETGIEVKDD